MLSALLDPVAAGAFPGHFSVTHDAAGYSVDATADLAADQALVWDTLTDYERLPQFVPGIRSVHVLESQEEEGNAGNRRLIVEQAGELRFLFFSRRVRVLLDVRHEPQTRVEARALPRPQGADSDEASLNQFEATYTLMPIPGGVRLGYRAHFAPGFALPPILGPLAVRRTMQAQFEAMLSEIDRRRLAPSPQGPPR